MLHVWQTLRRQRPRQPDVVTQPGSAAQRIDRPGVVLEQANELLYPDIPRNIFITWLYAILKLHTGHLLFANAGHDLPPRCHKDGTDELRVMSMPQSACDVLPESGEPHKYRTLASFALPSAPGNERQAMRDVAVAVAPLRLPNTGNG